MRKQYHSTTLSTFRDFLIKLPVGYRIFHHITFNVVSDPELTSRLRSGRVHCWVDTSTQLCSQGKKRGFSPSGLWAPHLSLSLTPPFSSSDPRTDQLAPAHCSASLCFCRLVIHHCPVELGNHTISKSHHNSWTQWGIVRMSQEMQEKPCVSVTPFLAPPSSLQVQLAGPTGQQLGSRDTGSPGAKEGQDFFFLSWIEKKVKDILWLH